MLGGQPNHRWRKRSGSVVECLAGNRGGCRFEPHQRHFVVVLEQDIFILAKYWFNPGRPSLFNGKIVDGT